MIACLQLPLVALRLTCCHGSQSCSLWQEPPSHVVKERLSSVQVQLRITCVTEDSHHPPTITIIGWRMIYVGHGDEEK